MAARERCDILVLPELCVTPGIQLAIQSAVRSTHLTFGCPWLVVAGSAHTPLRGDPARFHNRAVVYDRTGTQWLQHNKLHRYEIKPHEQDRYGIADALGETPRFEDITVLPRVVELLETPIGPVAVLICEDLGVPSFVHSLLGALEIDWLLVPVMDGIQVEQRWTGIRSKDYSFEHGTSFVIATCSALVAAHRQTVRKKDSDPGQKVGLLVVAGRQPVELAQTGSAGEPILYRIGA